MAYGNNPDEYNDPTAFDVPQTGDSTAFDVPQAGDPTAVTVHQDPFDVGVALVTGAMSGGGDGQADIYGTSAPGAGLAAESGGIASSLGSNWIAEKFGKALEWYEKQGDMTKAGINTMAGSFIKGLFSYNDEQRKIKALEKSSDATMLNAQTNASATERKFDNASAIGKTNFGAQPQGLIFRNKLAPRQTRAGYGG